MSQSLCRSRHAFAIGAFHEQRRNLRRQCSPFGHRWFRWVSQDLPLANLASAITRAAIERSGVAASDVGHVVMGTVIPTEPRDAYLSRVASMNAGVPKETPAFNVNRLCGSGLQAIVSAAQTLLLVTLMWPWPLAPNP